MLVEKRSIEITVTVIAIVVVVVAFVGVHYFAQGPPTKISDILADPNKYFLQEVTVVGYVRDSTLRNRLASPYDEIDLEHLPSGFNPSP